MSISIRAGECRSRSSLSSESEKKRVEAAATVSTQSPEYFNALEVFEDKAQEG